MLLHNNCTGIYYAAQINLADSVTQISSMTGNVLFGLTANAWTLALDGGSLLASDNNYFFHPNEAMQITTGGWSGRKTFSQWQAWSGLDAASTANWYQLAAGAAQRSEVFINPTPATQTVFLGGRRFLDLDQNPVSGSLTLGPYSSQVLIGNGPADLIFSDGFDSGDAGRWSAKVKSRGGE
jgi:hypothetical protein